MKDELFEELLGSTHEALSHAQRARLERAGWAVGSVEDFLGGQGTLDRRRAIQHVLIDVQTRKIGVLTAYERIEKILGKDGIWPKTGGNDG